MVSKHLPVSSLFLGAGELISDMNFYLYIFKDGGQEPSGLQGKLLGVFNICTNVTALFWLTLTSMTLVIFHKSIRRPMKTLTCTTKLVSLSSMYSSTTRDWKTPNMMERTDRPSRDCLLFQNWISVREMVMSWGRQINWNFANYSSVSQSRRAVVTLPFLKARNSKMLCTMETMMVRPSRYGLVSKSATCTKRTFNLIWCYSGFNHKVH